ncbi:MAG: hypothetical protein SRB1_02004 [Desulfobacteraceae bacterium Eth-SRB1]|nr:MAG: hypothetical protein SRB1_02004 [Desulfobacteraceae bacterium Eth-SRB1]
MLKNASIATHVSKATTYLGPSFLRDRAFNVTYISGR